MNLDGIQPDALIRVRFRTEEEGGKRIDLGAEGVSPFYSCPLAAAGENFDCRLYYHDRVLRGETYDLPVAFLRPEIALKKVSSGLAIQLLEGRVVADGWVVETYASGTRTATQS